MYHGRAPQATLAEMPRDAESKTSESTAGHRSTRRRWFALILIPLAIGLFCRLHGLQEVLVDDRAELIDPDSYYHAWRASEAARTFPSLPPQIDPMVNHPDGHTVAWPPGFSYFVGGVGRLLGIPNQAEHMARLGTVVVVCVGLLGIMMIFALALRLGASPPWATLAGVIFALWPIIIEYSRIGRFDHHVLEPVFTAGALFFYLGAKWGERRSRRLANALACGLILGAAFWLWPSALFPVAILSGAMILHQGFGLRSAQGPQKDEFAVEVAIFVVSWLVVAPLVARAPETSRWTMQMPSFFHLVLVTLCLGSALALSIYQRYFAGRHSKLADGIAVLGLPLMVTGICLLAFPLEEGLRNLFRFGRRSDLWQMIFEQRSLFSLPWPHQKMLFTYLGFGIPLVYLGQFLSPQGSHSAIEKQRFVLLLSVPFWLVGLTQIRFLALPLVIVTPLIATSLAAVVLRWKTKRSITVLLFLLPIALISPALTYLSEGLYLPNAKTKNRRALALWFRNVPNNRTAVLAPIAAGHVLIHLGRVRTLGTPLIMPSTAAANRETIRFYTTENEAEARGILSRRKISHVVAAPIPWKRWQRYRQYLGQSVSEQSYRRSIAGKLFRAATSRRSTTSKIESPFPWLRHVRSFRTKGHRLELYRLHPHFPPRQPSHSDPNQ
jgi:hypothetical protein